MRIFTSLLFLGLLAIPVSADLSSCSPIDVKIVIDPSAAEWSRQIPAGECFEVDVENPPGYSCSYGTSVEEVVPDPLVSSAVTGRTGALAPPPAEIGPYRIGRCEAFKVRVICPAVPATPGTPALTKIDRTYTVTTGQCGRWVTHYGVGFLSDDNEEFFASAEVDDDGMPTGNFVIKAEADNRDDFESELVVTFTYLPSGGKPGRFPRFGFLGGLGADLDERLVFGGVSVLWGENVNLFVGAAGHMRTHLDGQYEVGQKLKENLAADKLLDETFSIDLIFGAAFRFDSNPFKKK